MKKLFPLIVFLAIPFLLFTGCALITQNNTPATPSLPGAWVNSVETNGSTRNVYNSKGTLTPKGNLTFVYSLQHPDQIAAEQQPASGNWNFYNLSLTTEGVYTGFKATVSGSTSNYCGFIFNYSIDTSSNSYPESCYILALQGNSFSLLKKERDVLSNMNNWTYSEAIKSSTLGNEVLVYKDGTSITIQVNGVTIYTISNPVLTSGKVGVIASVSDDEVTSGAPIQVTYKFSEFQK